MGSAGRTLLSAHLRPSAKTLEFRRQDAPLAAFLGEPFRAWLG